MAAQPALAATWQPIVPATLVQPVVLAQPIAQVPVLSPTLTMPSERSSPDTTATASPPGCRRPRRNPTRRRCLCLPCRVRRECECSATAFCLICAHEYGM